MNKREKNYVSSLVHLLAVVCTKRKPRDREREGRLGNEIGRIHFTEILIARPTELGIEVKVKDKKSAGADSNSHSVLPSNQ